MVCLAAPHCDASEFFEFREEILDEMAPLIDLRVKLRWRSAIGFWRDDGCDPGLGQILSHPIGVKGPVGEHLAAGQAFKERFGSSQIMGLSGQKSELHQRAEGVDEREDLRRHPAARASYGLAFSPPFAP